LEEVRRYDDQSTEGLKYQAHTDNPKERSGKWEYVRLGTVSFGWQQEVVLRKFEKKPFDNAGRIYSSLERSVARSTWLWCVSTVLAKEGQKRVIKVSGRS